MSEEMKRSPHAAEPPAKPIIVRTYSRFAKRYSLYEKKILKPITAKERKAGIRDEYSDWVKAHGLPTSTREKPRRVAYIQEKVPEDAHLDFIMSEEGLPSRHDQEEIYKMMYPTLRLMALGLWHTRIIGLDEVHDVAMRLFIDCLCEVKNWDPNNEKQASLKTFLYECAASAATNLIIEANAKKREYSYTRFSITSDADDDELDSTGIVSGAIGMDKLGDARALYKMEFAWALADLEALLTPEEQLALKYLLEDYTDEDIARWMGLTRMQFRRGVWWSLQCKAALCGFVPKEGPFAKSQKEPTKKS